MENLPAQEKPDVEMEAPMTEEEQKLEEQRKEEAAAFDKETDDLQKQLDNLHEEEHPQVEGQSISSMVNQAYVEQIMDMGFPKAVAEKALFMTQGQGGTTESALDWISQHQEDADFYEELRIVGQTEAKPKSTMSLEEKLRKAKELQDQIRKRRAEEEKRNQEAAERNRIRSTKELQEAKRKMDEQQRKLALDAQKREKEEFNNAKRAMLEQLRRDKEERFGKAIPREEGNAAAAQPAQKKLDPVDQIKHGIKTVRTLYTEDRQPGVAKTCFKTLTVYLGNVLKDPNEQKFRKINLQNEAFQKRVGKITGGLSILKGAGFVENEASQMMEMHEVNQILIKEAIRMLENNL